MVFSALNGTYPFFILRLQSGEANHFFRHIFELNTTKV